jgi:hypothetical protein
LQIIISEQVVGFGKEKLAAGVGRQPLDLSLHGGGRNVSGRHTSKTCVYFPVPERVIVCEPCAVLSDSVSVAERAPVTVGLNFTEIVQVLFAPKVFPTGQVLVWEKSAALVPVIVMLFTLSV